MFVIPHDPSLETTDLF